MSGIEDVAKSLGIDIVSSPEQVSGEQTAPEVVESTEPVLGAEEETATEESDVLENNDTPTTEEEVATETESVEQVGEVANSPDSEPVSEPTDSEVATTPSVSFDDADVLKALSEMVGFEETLTKEDLMDIFSGEAVEEEKAPELDPTVQVIADFIAETGRTVEDWFAYQSTNPSEMDDLTVMTASLRSQYPNLSDEDAQLLLDNKYKLNTDEYSENDVRLGKLQLQMDATTARAELEKVREQFKAPKVENTTAPEQSEATFESPIDENWIAEMSKTVDSMETLKFKVGDKDFNFALKPEYRSELKKANADLENYFVQYIDDAGNWDMNKLSQQRAIVDNIESIVSAVYSQGLSDGQSNVVKEAVNPSAPAANSNSVDTSSAEDKVRQQILNALKGSDDTLRIRF